jgi:hypothetical protein
LATRRRSDDEAPPSRRRPATTPAGRENQLVVLATDLAERQMREGTASAQVISHYLKLGSSREQLEQARLAAENELLRARVEEMASRQRVEELYTAALNAMRSYSGQPAPEIEYDDED